MNSRCLPRRVSQRLVADRGQGEVNGHASRTPRDTGAHVTMKRIALALQETVTLRLTVLQGVQDFVRTRQDWQLVRSAGSLVLTWDEAWAARPDGIIGFIGGDGLPARYQREVPVVCVNSIYDAVDAVRVRSDAHAVGRMAASHFVELGYKRFAFGTDVPGHYYSRMRLAGYREALVEAGFAVNVLSLSANLEDFQADVAAIKLLPERCAVYCVTDGCARRVLTLCEEQSIRVPEQLAVLGTDNDPFHCEGGRVLLSSIDVNHRKVGHEAAHALNRILEGEQTPTSAVEVPPAGVISRTSTDPAAAARHPVVIRAMQTIESRYRDREFTAEKLAQICGVSSRTIGRLFRQQGLRSPHQMLLSVRVAAAKELLERTDRTAEDIAFACGFAEYSSFFRVFKNQAGIPPSALR
jgi:LacI family transcriptional regulator